MRSAARPSESAAWPKAPRWPLVGHVPALLTRGFMPFVEQSWRSLGDCFELCAGGARIKIIIHPDDTEAILLSRRDRYIKGAAYDQFRQVVGVGLITSEGELWRRQRRLIQPSFTRESIARIAELVVDQAERMVEGWCVRAPEAEAFDVHPEFQRLALEVIGRGLFSLEFGERRTQVPTRAFGESLEILGKRVIEFAVPPRWLPTPTNRRLARAIAELEAVVWDIVEARRSCGELGDDLLGALLRAGEDQGIDRVQLRDEVVTMFLAGHETTAVALSWTLWQLSQNPEALARLEDELERVLGGRRPTLADLRELPWARQVLLESMRLIPPAWGGARNCVAADELGPGLPVAPGDRVIHVMHLTHRHPEFWPEPERFDPERFEPARFARQHKFAYTPFSEGPRKCVGQHLATMEVLLVLATVLQRGELSVAEGFVPEPDYQLTTRPKHGLQVRWKRR